VDPVFWRRNAPLVNVVVTGWVQASTSIMSIGTIAPLSIATFTLSLLPSIPTDDVVVTLTVPSSAISITGGTTFTIPAGGSSIEIEVTGLTVSYPFVATWGKAISNDNVYNNAQAFPSITFTVTGTIAAQQASVKVGIAAGRITTVGLVCNPIPSSDVSIVMSPPSFATIQGGNTVIIKAGNGTASIVLVSTTTQRQTGELSFFAGATSADPRFVGVRPATVIVYAAPGNS
jgi:hypothetical protein